jgi:mevalonate kinase
MQGHLRRGLGPSASASAAVQTALEECYGGGCWVTHLIVTVLRAL